MEDRTTETYSFNGEYMYAGEFRELIKLSPFHKQNETFVTCLHCTDYHLAITVVIPAKYVTQLHKLVNPKHIKLIYLWMKAVYIQYLQVYCYCIDI